MRDFSTYLSSGYRTALFPTGCWACITIYFFSCGYHTCLNPATLSARLKNLPVPRPLLYERFDLKPSSGVRAILETHQLRQLPLLILLQDMFFCETCSRAPCAFFETLLKIG